MKKPSSTTPHKNTFQSANLPQPSKRSKRKLWIILSIVLFIILGLLWVFVLPKGGIVYSPEQKAMDKYLREKYGQEFVVGDARVEGGGLGVKGAWVAEAYPKSDRSLKFKIDLSRYDHSVIDDRFLETLWSKQGRSEIEDFLRKEIPDNEGYYLTIRPGSYIDSIQGYTPSLEDARKDRNGSMTYSLSVRSAVDTVPDEPSEAQLEDALKVVNFVKSKNNPSLSYAYYNYRDKSYNAKDKFGDQLYQYGVHVELDELNTATGTSNLKNYFEKLR